MNYIPLSTLPTKAYSEDEGESRSTPFDHFPSPSSFPPMPTRRTSDCSTYHSEAANSWIRPRRGGTANRKILIYLSLSLFAVFLVVFWIGTSSNAEDREEGGTTAWALSVLGRRQDRFLLKRPLKRTPHYARRVLTNPLEPKQRLQYDVTLTLDSVPDRIVAGEPSSITVRCAHADLEQCAKSYRILFVGPTIRSTFHSDSHVIDSRHVQVRFRIDDPGEYQLCGWPEFETCDFWSREKFWTGPKFYTLAIGGTPYQIGVEGKAPKEESRACTAEDDLAGRWISKSYLAPEALEVGSPFYEWARTHLDPSPPAPIDAFPPVRLLDYKSYGYVYIPYQCKIPHRTAFEWMDEIKPNSILVVGDAVTRDYFCMSVGVKDQEVCRYTTDPDLDYREANKRTSYTRSDGGTTDLYFHWNPVAWGTGLFNFLETLPSPPSHVFFAATLWITRRNYTSEHYVETIRPFLKEMITLLPDAKIITRTTSSAVQPLGCWELANITRPVLEPVNKAFLELLRVEFPSIKVLDAYPIYNDRPESSSDGVRWERFPGSSHARPEEGAVSHTLTDLIFETWRLQS
ncbi:uncharacterized protein JCM6883_001633 [Sporobolomyces salmoneus]|uniref:uncharacterized protein n=1 Tax=Sporobolomyces salmoneus TaxID=183962 RepID=UPI00317891E9